MKHKTHADLRRNITKLLCLTLGLTMGFILTAKVYYEKTFDMFFPDASRIYLVYEQFQYGDEAPYDFNTTSGAYAPALKDYLPQVELATRFRSLSSGDMVFENGDRVESNGINATDTCFFDVFRQEIISGDPHEVLATSGQCMIPESLAERIGGEPVGKTFEMPALAHGFKIMIGGIYKDFPDNSSIPNCIYLGIPSMKTLDWSGWERWVGNEVYHSFVMLRKGTNPEELQAGIDKLVKENVPEEVLKESHQRVGLKKFVGFHLSDQEIKNMNTLLSVLAALVILCAAVNFLLIVIGQIKDRTKEMAVRKCFGTGSHTIFRMVTLESLFYITAASVLAILIVLTLSDKCRDLLGVSAFTLLSTPYVWLTIVCIMAITLVITGVIPGIIYSRTPVISAFRGNTKSRKAWKLSMLALQFVTSGFLFCLLVLVMRQYNHIHNIDMGYDFENAGTLTIDYEVAEKSGKVVDELRRDPDIKGVATSYIRLTSGVSGGSLWDEGQEENRIKIRHYNFVNREFFDVLGIEFISGRTFRENADSTVHEIVVDKRLADALATNYGVEDVVGRTFHTDGLNAEPEDFTICGVVNNVRMGGFKIGQENTTPMIYHPTDKKYEDIFIRFNEMDAESVMKAQNMINELIPEKPHFILPLRSMFAAYTVDIEKFAGAVRIVAIVILLIALSGLLGYVSDEVERRSKEIAIRKVTGTDRMSVVTLFCTDIIKVALPSLLAGGALAFIYGRKWISQFSEQVSMAPLIFLCCIIMLMIVILCIVVANSLKMAGSNPVDYLRDE